MKECARLRNRVTLALACKMKHEAEDEVNNPTSASNMFKGALQVMPYEMDAVGCASAVGGVLKVGTAVVKGGIAVVGDGVATK